MLSGVLVFFMQAGFTLIESGSVQKKNHHTILVKNIMCPCIAGLLWWLWGHRFAYGERTETYYGQWFLSYGFASATASIVSGSIAERVTLISFCAHVVIMTGFIYPLLVSWTWGGGWLY